MPITDAIGLNIATIAGVIGLVVLLMWAQTSKKKKDKRMTLTYVWVIGVVVFLIGAFANVAFLTDPLSGGVQEVVTVPTSAGAIVAGCSVEDTTVTLSAIDKFTAAATGGTHTYKLNGQPSLTVSDAGTLTASPGDSLEVLWVSAATTSTYYGAVDSVTIPCKGTFAHSAELYGNGTLTVNVFNEEGNLIDGLTENETLGAGDVANLKIEVSGQNKKGFPYGGVFTLEVNGTEYDEEEISLSFGDLTLTKTTTPQVHTLSAVGSKTLSWSVGAIEGSALHTGTLTLDADDTYNPTNAGDPVLTFRPYNYFVNDDTGASFDGPAVEDEDNAATYGYSTTATVSVD